MGISLRHSGHFFVVGSGGASPLLRRAIQAFIGATMNRYTASAIIRNEIRALRNAPYMILLLLIVTLKFEKSGLPPMAAIRGVKIFVTSAVITAPKAAPITTATA